MKCSSVRWLAAMILVATRLLPSLSQNEKVFTPAEYMAVVAQYHPIARQAALLPEQARQSLLVARGGFDPKVAASWDAKSFDDKNYFDLFRSEVKVPTWYGVDIKAAFDMTNGEFFNPQDKTPKAGLGTLGVSVPVLQGLLTDGRRTAIQQAKVMSQLNSNEQLSIINELLYDALKTYWDWALAYNELITTQNYLLLSEVRFELVRQVYIQGDRPAIDTLEAFIVVQDRQYLYNEALVKFRNATLELSNFLWGGNGSPLQLGGGVIPVLLDEQAIVAVATGAVEEMLRNVAASHPDLQWYSFRLQELELERRLKAEMLKPRLDVQYNFLAERFNYANGDSRPILNDYKVGLQFQMPLLLRKERGSLALTRLKITETNLKRTDKQLQLENKVRAAANDVANSVQQVALYTAATENYRRLYLAEQERFRLGESSVFLMNARELKLLEAQLKLLEIKAKYHKHNVGLLYAAGLLRG